MDEEDDEDFGTPVVETEPPPEIAERQLSLKQLLGLMAFASLLLAPLPYLKLEVYTGLLGVLTVFCLLIMSWWKPRMFVVEIGFWLMMGLYVLAAIAAISTIWR